MIAPINEPNVKRRRKSPPVGTQEALDRFDQKIIQPDVEDVSVTPLQAQIWLQGQVEGIRDYLDLMAKDGASEGKTKDGASEGKKRPASDLSSDLAEARLVLQLQREAAASRQNTPQSVTTFPLPPRRTTQDLTQGVLGCFVPRRSASMPAQGRSSGGGPSLSWDAAVASQGVIAMLPGLPKCPAVPPSLRHGVRPMLPAMPQQVYQSTNQSTTRPMPPAMPQGVYQSINQSVMRPMPPAMPQAVLTFGRVLTAPALAEPPRPPMPIVLPTAALTEPPCPPMPIVQPTAALTEPPIMPSAGTVMQDATTVQHRQGQTH